MDDLYLFTSQLCATGYYRQHAFSPATECVACSDVYGVSCPIPNTTIETLQVNDGHWRLSGRSLQTVKCAGADSGTSPCLGGVDTGSGGSGYCATGHSGPRCELCTESSQHFSGGTCVDCPKASTRILILFGVVVGVFTVMLGGVAAVYRILRRALPAPPPRTRDWIRRSSSAEMLVRSQEVAQTLTTTLGPRLHRLVAQISSMNLTPKLKLTIAFFQSASLLPTVYDIKLPDYYFDFTNFLKVFQIDWSSIIYPTGCFSSFQNVLLTRALGPIFVVFVVIVGTLTARILPHLRGRKEGALPWRKGLLDALPSIVFIAFVLTPSTSTSIFAAADPAAPPVAAVASAETSV